MNPLEGGIKSQVEHDLKEIEPIWLANQKALHKIAEMGGFAPARGRHILKPGTAWVCPSPEQLYKHMDRAYHVTGSEAIKRMLNGNKSIVSSYNLFFSENQELAVSHRGAAGYVVEDFVENLGMSRTGAESSVWAGPQVDNDQVIIEREISAHPGLGSRLIYDALFEKYPIDPLVANRPNPPSLYCYNKSFQKLMSQLRDGAPIDDCQEIIHKISYATWVATGLREGFYENFYNRLNGIVPIPQDNHDYFQDLFKRGISGMNRILMDTLYNEAHGVNSVEPGQAVVIPIKPTELFKKHARPQLVIPGDTPRDPRTIIGVDSIALEDIDGEVYVFDPDALSPELQRALRENHIEVRSVNDIDAEARLDPNLGFDRSFSEIDPNNPMCSRRYGRKPAERQAEYAEAVRMGYLAPLFPITLDSNDPGYQKACLALGNDVLPTGFHLLPSLPGVLSL